MNLLVRSARLLAAATAILSVASRAQEGAGDVTISWGPTLTLTADTLGDGSPELLVSGDTIHLFWFEGDGPGGAVAYARSTDEGATFGTPSRILEIGAAGNWVSPQGLSFAAAGGIPRITGTLYTLDSALNFHNFIALAASVDGGASWGSLDPVDACADFCFTPPPGLVTHGETLYQLITRYYAADTIPLRLSISTDGGMSWRSPVPIPSGNRPSRIGADDAGLHYVGSFPTDTTDELFYQRTTDLGATWTGTILTPTYDGFADDPALALSGDGRVYAAWRGTLDGTPDGYAEHVSFRRSTDDGVTWDLPAIVCSSSSVEFTVLASRGSRVAVTWGNYASDTSDVEQVIVVSTDHGATWSDLLPMPVVGWNALAVSSGYLHNAWAEAGGGSAAPRVHYRRGVIETVVSAGDGPVPPAFTLGQNYPNPFNGTTSITYVLAARARVTLRVFTLLGEPVATLVDGSQAEGAHTVRWNPDPLAAGVYYYRIQAGAHSATNKLLYVR